MLKARKSINDYGGIKAYLDHPTQKLKHNGYGYADLIKNRHNGPAFLRDMFMMKHTKTIYDWLARVDKESK